MTLDYSPRSNVFEPCTNPLPIHNNPDDKFFTLILFCAPSPSLIVFDCFLTSRCFSSRATEIVHKQANKQTNLLSLSLSFSLSRSFSPLFLFALWLWLMVIMMSLFFFPFLSYDLHFPSTSSTSCSQVIVFLFFLMFAPPSPPNKSSASEI